MALPGAGGALSAASAATGSSTDDPSKKIRKPYTITKSRESWTEQEHDRFLEALQLFDRDWRKIEAFVGSKTVIQIRSHAQKYFLKVQKNGTSEHVPPPRPKRKAAHPYPQKASKNAATPQLTHATTTTEASCMLELQYPPTTDTSAMHKSSLITATMPSWPQSSIQTVTGSHLKGDVGPTGDLIINNCCCSSTESPQTNPAYEIIDQENNAAALCVLPDFAQVYSFLGSIFDPNVTGHVEKLKYMDPIDVETVFLLMRNLSINLTSPDFETHRMLLSSYAGGLEEGRPGICKNMLRDKQDFITPFLVKSE